jgi:hypothetical protein
LDKWLLFNANSAIFQLYQGENISVRLVLIGHEVLRKKDSTKISNVIWEEGRWIFLNRFIVSDFWFFFYNENYNFSSYNYKCCLRENVDTEMWCPKGKCGCQYFILLTLKNNIMYTGVLDFFNKKLILDYYICLLSGPFFLFQIFIPSQGIYNCIINNKLINNKFRFPI